MEALTPPAQLSEWHMLAIKSFRTVQAILDLQPKDDVIGFADFILIAAAAGDLEEKLDEVSARLPEDIRRQMIEVGCIDPEDVPDDREDVPDDHGNDIDGATVAAVGVDVEGALEYDGDSGYFRFTAEGSQLYQIDVSLGSLPDSYLELRDSDGRRLESNDDHGDSSASRIVWEAPASGDYYLVVGGYGAGSYTLTVAYSDIADDHGDDIDDATTATVGVDVEGVIDYEGDSDYFRFTAEGGQLYQIDVSLVSLPDSYLELRDSDGWSLESNDDHGDSPASRVFWEAPASGDYYLEVGGYGAGSYTLTVAYSDIADDHGDDIDDATTATVGVDVEGVIDYEGDSDYFRFTAEGGQLYQIDVSLGSLPDSYLELRDSDGRRLESNDDHGDSSASRIVWEAPASGDYYLVVGGYGAGSYTLTVAYSDIADDHGNDIDDATTAAVGVDVEGALDYEGDSDYFRFTAEGGQLYQIDVSLGSLPDSYLELRDSDGWSLESNDDHGDSSASRIVWRAPDAVEYFLVVAGSWDHDVGSYTLTVAYSDIVDDYGDDIDDATMATVGVDVEGVIDYEGDSDYFRFTAEGGQLYQIDVSLGSLPDSYLELRDSDGWSLESNDDHGDSSASRIVWRAPDAVEYFLVVAGSWDHDVGSYTLTVAYSDIVDDYGDDIDDATTATVGVDVEGVIDYEGDSDYFRFTAEGGQLYQIDVALGSLPDSVLTLLGPDRGELAYNDDHGDSPASRVFWEAPASGDYYLAVEAIGWDARVGSYTLTVTRR